MVPQLNLWLAYVPAFVLFLLVARFSGVGSRWSLATAGIAIISGALLLLQTFLPNPVRSFINWLPWIVLVATLVLLLRPPLRRWCSLVVCLMAAAIFIHKANVINQDWQLAYRWFNSFFVILLPLIAAWYSFTRNLNDRHSNPLYRFGLIGFLTATGIICYIIAGTSQTALILGCVGVLCAAGFIVSIWRFKLVDLTSISLLFAIVLWMSTLYTHYFTDQLPLLVSAFLLTAPVIIGWADFQNLSLKWRILLPVVIFILGAGAAGYMIYEDFGTDEFGY